VFDSTVGGKSDVPKSAAQCEVQGISSCDWDEIEKKATKASDDDLKKLTSTLSNSWTDLSTMSKIAAIATVATVAAPTSTIQKIAALAPATVKVATSVVSESGSAIWDKVTSTGSRMLNWAIGGKEKPQAPAVKPETKTTPAAKTADAKTTKPTEAPTSPVVAPKPAEQPKPVIEAKDTKPVQASTEAPGLAASILDSLTPDALKSIWNEGKSIALVVLPDALVRAEDILFGTNIQGAEAPKGPVKNETSDETAAPPATPVEAPAAPAETPAQVTASNTTPVEAAKPVAEVKPETLQEVPAVKPDEVPAAAPEEVKESKEVLVSVSEQAPETTEPTAQPQGDKPAPTVEGEKVTYIDPLSNIKLEADKGTIRTLLGERALGTQAELFAAPDGSRVYQKGDRQVYKFINLRQFQAGEFDFNGEVLKQARQGQTLMIAGRNGSAHYMQSLTLFRAPEANTVEEALAKLKEQNLEPPKNKTSLIYLKGGAALIHPDLNSVLEFKRTADGVEIHFELGDGTELLRSPKGKVYLVDKDKQIKELSEEQKLALIAKLGPRADVVKHLLQSMESGAPIVLPDGQKVEVQDETKSIIHSAANPDSASGESQPPTVTVFDGSGGVKVTDPVNSFSFDASGTLTTTDAQGKVVEVELDSPKFDMKTDEFVRKDGAVTFTETNTKLEEDGKVVLSNGTIIGAKNDVFFADGSVLYRDGTLISKDGQIISTAMNVPQKANLDGFVSQAISMASSIASRVQSGACSLSDIALIEANMSVVMNFINLFSILGNMPMANSLYRSWAILKDSHGRAQNETVQQGNEEKMLEEQVRSFFKNLEMNVGPVTQPVNAGDAGLSKPSLAMQNSSMYIPSASQFHQLVR